MKTFIVIFFFLFSFPLHAKQQYVVINHHENVARGFFSVMDYVFTCIDWIETHPNQYSGFEVDFKQNGIYYDPAYGPNYWSYYFKPLQVGDRSKNSKVNIIREFKGVSPLRNEHLDKFLVNERVQKYIQLNEPLEEEIQNFVDLHFNDRYVIGVHYRGTDKSREAKRVSYQAVLKEILTEIDQAPENWHIFIATDEQPFLDHMVKLFPGRVSYLEGIERSDGKKPLHFHNSSPYHQGKSAVMDCILLSKTDILLRTCSNLNRWSTYFNPLLKERELSKRNGQK